MESTTELKVLNSLCTTRDIQPLLGAGKIDEMFVEYPDVWDWIKNYYSKHRAVPAAEIVQQNFKQFNEHGAPEVKGETSYYVDMLREEHVNGKLGEIILKMQSKKGKIAGKALVKGAVAELMELQNIAIASDDIDITDFESAVKDYEATRLLAKQMGGVPGIPTGISFIDSAYTSGLVGGDLVVVLGWTGRAKSLLTTKICVNAFNKGFRPMIVSLEMKTKKVRDRAYTMMGDGLFKNSDLEVGDVNEDDFREFSKSIKNKGFNIIAHSGSEVTPAFVQSKIDMYKPSIVVLDYAQLMMDNACSSDMTTRMRNMADQFKALAMANDIPIILISSATPDGTASINTPPIVEQVAWSKALSYNADLSFAVHRHDGKMDDGSVVIEIVCRKNRNGELFAGFFRANINIGTYEEHFTLENAFGIKQE